MLRVISFPNIVGKMGRQQKWNASLKKLHPCLTRTPPIARMVTSHRHPMHKDRQNRTRQDRRVRTGQDGTGQPPLCPSPSAPSTHHFVWVGQHDSQQSLDAAALGKLFTELLPDAQLGGGLQDLGGQRRLLLGTWVDARRRVTISETDGF